MDTRLRLRLGLATLSLAAGMLVLSPSFAFDSDRDGVEDSVEIFERGTDPASADNAFEARLVSNRARG
ncbi:MAG: hypothetical protein M3161_07435 [Actinomycetota bacterium]|nr:hypothetical protein [Actinomycetota bacterium]